LFFSLYSSEHALELWILDSQKLKCNNSWLNIVPVTVWLTMLNSAIMWTMFSVILAIKLMLLKIQNQLLHSLMLKKELLWIYFWQLKPKLKIREFLLSHNSQIMIEHAVAISLLNNSDVLWRSLVLFHQKKTFSKFFLENILTRETSEK